MIQVPLLANKEKVLSNQTVVHVGNESYIITAFLTSKGLRIKSKIIKYFGASLTEALGADDEASIAGPVS